MLARFVGRLTEEDRDCRNRTKSQIPRGRIPKEDAQDCDEELNWTRRRMKTVSFGDDIIT